MDQELKRQDLIVENGQIIINGNKEKYNILLLDIIGEIEGHVSLPSDTKTTKYEHILPELAVVQDDESIKGVLVLLNTVGGDVEAGLAIAEMLASISKPVVTLVLGGVIRSVCRLRYQVMYHLSYRQQRWLCILSEYPIPCWV